MTNRRRSFDILWMASLTAFFGLTAFIGVSTNPRFKTIHVLDVIRLMTAGAGFALAIFLLMLFIRRPRFLEDNRAGEKSGEKSN